MAKSFSSAAVLQEAAQIARDNPLATAVYGLAYCGSYAAFTGYSWFGGRPPGIAGLLLSGLITYVLSYVVQWWITLSLTFASLRAAGDGKLDLSAFSIAHRWLGKYILVWLVQSVAYAIAQIPMLIGMVLVYAAMGPSLQSLQSLTSLDLYAINQFVQDYGFFVIVELLVIGVGIIPPFLASTYLGFAPCVLMDKNSNANFALGASIKVARGAILPLINFSVACALINLAGALCLGIGLLVTLPITWLAFVLAYRDLLRQTEAQLGAPLGQRGMVSASTGEV